MKHGVLEPKGWGSIPAAQLPRVLGTDGKMRNIRKRERSWGPRISVVFRSSASIFDPVTKQFIYDASTLGQMMM